METLKRHLTADGDPFKVQQFPVDVQGPILSKLLDLIEAMPDNVTVKRLPSRRGGFLPASVNVVNTTASLDSLISEHVSSLFQVSY